MSERVKKFKAGLPTLTDDELEAETRSMIWLSAWADNNPRSEYHAMSDACWEEAMRRKNRTIYKRAYDAVVREVSA